MRARTPRAAVFGIVIVSFLLPFVEVKCAEEELFRETAAGLALVDQSDEAPRQTFSGIDLIAGTAPLVPRLGDQARVPLVEDEDELSGFRVPPEPLAQVAFIAAVVGLVLALWASARRSYLGGAIAGLVSSGALLMMLMSPSVRRMGLVVPIPQVGFYVAFFGSIAAGVWSRRELVEHDEARRRLNPSGQRPTRPPPIPGP